MDQGGGVNIPIASSTVSAKMKPLSLIRLSTKANIQAISLRLLLLTLCDC